MTDTRKNIVLRFGIVYVIVCLSFLLVIYKIVVIQFVEKDQWMALAARSVKTDIQVRPNRGNIFDCNGQLMASSIPTYYAFLDLRVPALHENNGKLLKDNIDSLSMYLSSFFRDRTPYQYKSLIMQAFREGKGEFPLYPDRISYSKLKTLKTFPLFRLGRNKSGLITKEQFRRVKPFGSLASRTIGDIYPDESKGGKNGLELGLNSALKGTPGLSTRQKVANTYMETVQLEPIDGEDVNTTIDVDIQDIAEKALREGLVQFQAAEGCAIVMETHSGEVKAIVNLQRNPDGTYSENRNGAVSNMTEPGSTFKVASLMAAVDEGRVKITDTINTYNGYYKYANKIMTDHNANHGGFHLITVAQAIYGSSNIGVSRAIVKAYGHDPAAFVDKLYSMKLNQPLHLHIPGTAAPYIRHPGDKAHYWSATTLPWMAVGYETQIPPIYTLTFYNAIANDGKMISPLFVKSLSRDGQVVKEFTPEVINESICKPSTLRDIRFCLLGVVEDRIGTARNVKSKYVRIAGKSGTAQISQGAEGYKVGRIKHQVSFCGFFPYEHPLYTAIVVMEEPTIGYASGGTMSGSVFKNIAEQMIALRSVRQPAEMEPDSVTGQPLLPVVKNGCYEPIGLVLKDLNLNVDGNNADWVKTFSDNRSIHVEPVAEPDNHVPDLLGMGAKDAVYLAEKYGLNVRSFGRGKVISQQPAPGTAVRRGSLMIINME